MEVLLSDVIKVLVLIPIRSVVVSKLYFSILSFTLSFNVPSTVCCDIYRKGTVPFIPGVSL